MREDGQHGERAPRPTSWTHRALGAGGRALGSAGHALTSAEQRGSSHLGATHLGAEALVAFVDGELGMRAHQRAAAHLAVCTECASDVQTQLQARAAVRAAGTPCPPAGLLGALRQIPDAQGPRPSPPLGVTVRGAVVLGEDGAWVSVLRPERYRSTVAAEGTVENGTDGVRHRRLGFPLAVLTVSALAVGVVATSATEATPEAATVAVGAAATPQTATSPVAGQAEAIGVLTWD